MKHLLVVIPTVCFALVLSGAFDSSTAFLIALAGGQVFGLAIALAD